MKTKTQEPDTKEQEEQNKRYTIEVTEKQLHLIKMMSDSMSRLIIGQLDKGISPYLEDALYKKHKGFTDDYYNDEDLADEHIEKLREICFNQKGGQSNGVGYSETADILIDINEVIRHFLYKERGDTQKATVDAYPAFKWSKEPLIKVKKINNMTENKKGKIGKKVQEKFIKWVLKYSNLDLSKALDLSLKPKRNYFNINACNLTPTELQILKRISYDKASPFNLKIEQNGVDRLAVIVNEKIK